MESLALAAAILVATTIFGGPISIIIARLTRSINKKISIFFTLVFAIPAFAVGFYLVTLNIGFGGRLMGLFGLITSAIGAAKAVLR